MRRGEVGRSRLGKPFLALGLAVLAVVAVSWAAFPEWGARQGGRLLLLAAAGRERLEEAGKGQAVEGGGKHR